MCYDMMEGIIDQKEIFFFIAELDLFTIKTITLLELKILSAIVFGVEVSIKDFTFNFLPFEGQIQVDSTPALIKVQELDIAWWTLHEDH
jgi:hypothetical protein